MPKAGGARCGSCVCRGTISNQNFWLELTNSQAIRRVHHGESISVLFQYDWAPCSLLWICVPPSGVGQVHMGSDIWKSVCLRTHKSCLTKCWREYIWLGWMDGFFVSIDIYISKTLQWFHLSTISLVDIFVTRGYCSRPRLLQAYHSKTVGSRSFFHPALQNIWLYSLINNGYWSP